MDRRTIEEVFPLVLEKVRQGLTIKESLISIKYNNKRFYSEISLEQKLELKVQKSLRSKWSRRNALNKEKLTVDFLDKKNTISKYNENKKSY